MELGTSLLLLRIVKLVLEICLLALVGQGIVFVLVRGIGQDAKRNFFYRVLETVSSPFVKLARYITPRFVPDRSGGHPINVVGRARRDGMVA